MEALWDSLVNEQFEIEFPEWHRDILEGRKIETGKTEFISLQELRASRATCTGQSRSLLIFDFGAPEAHANMIEERIK